MSNRFRLGGEENMAAAATPLTEEDPAGLA
jgi:hypothetical protein